MKDYSDKIQTIQQVLATAFAGSSTVKIVCSPQKWQGPPMDVSIVPIAVIKIKSGYGDLEKAIVSDIASDHHVVVSVTRGSNLKIREVFVYIQRKKSDLSEQEKAGLARDKFSDLLKNDINARKAFFDFMNTHFCEKNDGEILRKFEDLGLTEDALSNG